MREFRQSGSVEGVMGNHGSYSDYSEFGIGKTAKKIFGLAHPVRQPGTRDGLSYYTIAARCLSSVIVRVGRRLACRT